MVARKTTASISAWRVDSVPGRYVHFRLSSAALKWGVLSDVVLGSQLTAIVAMN